MILMSEILLYPIIIALFAFISWKKLEWGVYFIILALPAYMSRFQIFSIPFTLLESLIIVLFIVWLIRDKGKRHLRIGWLKDNRFLAMATGLFLLSATIAIFVAPELRAAAGIWKAYFIEPVLYFIVFIHAIDSRKKVTRVFWALGLSLVLPGLIAIYQKLTGNLIPLEFWANSETRRVTSVYGYPNAIGLYFAPIVTLYICWLVSLIKEKNHKIILGISLVAILGGLSILFAVSKGGVMAVAAGILFCSLFYRGRRELFAALLVAGIAAAYFMTPHLFSLEGQKTVEGGGSWESRQEQWSEAWQMLKTRPLSGAGLSGYQDRAAPYHQKDYIEIYMYPHQIFLNFWTEIGLLGVIAFIWIVAIFFYRGFVSSGHIRQEVNYYVLLMAAMAALLVHGLVDVPYFKNDLSVLFWIILGAMVVLHKNHRIIELKN